MRDFVAPSVKAMRPSGIRRFFEIAASLPDVVTLGIGEPSFATPTHVIDAAVDSLYAGQTGYTANSGLLELRTAVAGYVQRLYGVAYNPVDDVLITVGVSEALYLVLRAILDPGDAVLVVEPCFVANAATVEMAGGLPVAVPTRAEDGFQVTRAALEAAVTQRTKALLMSYPNNPTGAVLDAAHMADVAAFAEAHDLLVISDEIYERLVYDGPHTCFAALPNMRARTVLLSGMSKTFAMTGWRIGYALAPTPIMDAMRKLHQYLIMSAPTMGQVAALHALHHAEPDVEAMVAAYNARRQLIVAGFNAIGLPCALPRGAFYAFPDVRPTGMDDETFCERALVEAGVAVVPGSAFGASGRGHVRASYTSSDANIIEALDRLGRWLAALGVEGVGAARVPAR